MGPKYHQKYSCKIDAEGDHTDKRGEDTHRGKTIRQIGMRHPKANRPEEARG